MIDAPALSPLEYVSHHLMSDVFPSTCNWYPITVPAGMSVSPAFITVAVNTKWSPAFTVFLSYSMSVTTRSYPPVTLVTLADFLPTLNFFVTEFCESPIAVATTVCPPYPAVHVVVAVTLTVSPALSPPVYASFLTVVLPSITALNPIA